MRLTETRLMNEFMLFSLTLSLCSYNLQVSPITFHPPANYMTFYRSREKSNQYSHATYASQVIITSHPTQNT